MIAETLPIRLASLKGSTSTLVCFDLWKLLPHSPFIICDSLHNFHTPHSRMGLLLSLAAQLTMDPTRRNLVRRVTIAWAPIPTPRPKSLATRTTRAKYKRRHVRRLRNVSEVEARLELYVVLGGTTACVTANKPQQQRPVRSGRGLKWSA